MTDDPGLDFHFKELLKGKSFTFRAATWIDFMER
jgi:hypothetical protein